MDYSQITNFLEKFKLILFKKEEFYNIISKIIFNNTKIKTEINSIKIKNTIIYIEKNPIYKNEILIKKNKILLELKKEISNYNFTDIR